MNRKLPPYARKIQGAINNPNTRQSFMGTSPDGRSLTIWIAIGTEAWGFAKTRSKFLIAICPNDERPENYCWKFAKGHDPILITQQGAIFGSSLQNLIFALMRDGVKRILFFNGQQKSVRYVVEGCQDA